MIQVEFQRCHGIYRSFCVSGHAEYERHGLDIVCAGVSSAVQLTVNGICEVAGHDAVVSVLENLIALKLSDLQDQTAQAFMRALLLHLSCISTDYPGTIQVTDLEV